MINSPENRREIHHGSKDEVEQVNKQRATIASCIFTFSPYISIATIIVDNYKCVFLICNVIHGINDILQCFFLVGL